jgi:hypothetical protein
MRNKNNNSTFKPHVHLERLVKEKFGVYVEVFHDQFNPPILNHRNKPIRARTTVMAFRNIEDAKAASQNPGSVQAIALASSECSVNDTFEKRVGLTKAYSRLYRELAKGAK